MDKRWRIQADINAREYRKKKAYIRGVEAAENEAYIPSVAYTEAKKWVWAVEAAAAALYARSPEKYRFFAAYYGLEKPRFGHTDAEVLNRLCWKMHLSRSALSGWRVEAQDMLVLAAAQAGLLTPYEAEATCPLNASEQPPP